MEIVCLDLEGVLVPEIWITFSEKTGIKELSRTTRDESDYNKLMKYRIDILKKNNLKLTDIQDVIDKIEPLEGAKEFLLALREITQVVILSDTFSEFALPLMRKLNYPTILCNSLLLDSDGMISGIKMRQENGKKNAILGFKNMGFRTFSSGDSFNDLDMIHTSDDGVLFRAPENIKEIEKDTEVYNTYDELLERIKVFIYS